eukprot:6214826-Pleurochrysis_carterae.AAC.5
MQGHRAIMSKLICPAAFERATNIDLAWEEIKDVEKGVDNFGSPLITKKGFVRVNCNGAYMIDRMRLPARLPAALQPRQVPGQRLAAAQGQLSPSFICLATGLLIDLICARSTDWPAQARCLWRVHWLQHRHGGGECLATTKRDDLVTRAQWLPTVASQLWILSTSPAAGFTPPSTLAIPSWFMCVCDLATRAIGVGEARMLSLFKGFGHDAGQPICAPR